MTGGNDPNSEYMSIKITCWEYIRVPDDHNDERAVNQAIIEQPTCLRFYVKKKSTKRTVLQFESILICRVRRLLLVSRSPDVDATVSLYHAFQCF